MIRRFNARRRAHHHALRVGFFLAASTVCTLAAGAELCAHLWILGGLHLALLALCLCALFRAELDHNRRQAPPVERRPTQADVIVDLLERGRQK